MTGGGSLAIPVAIAPAELIDKITILEIKSERIRDPVQLDNVRRELALLVRSRDQAIPRSDRLDRLTAALKDANERLWEIEDRIRDRDRRQDFGAAFIELARSVYHTNDERAAIKRDINRLLGAAFNEEKSYTPY